MVWMTYRLKNSAVYKMTGKVCTRCEVKKLASEFSKRTKSLDGLQTYCKDCSKTYLSKWQDENRKHYSDYMRNRYQNNGGHRLAQLNRQRVRSDLENNKRKKGRELTSPKASSTLSLLGAPISVVNLWLDFTGNYTTRSSLMHNDNFIPCTKFDLSDPEQQKECFNWMNLRLIAASANLGKNAKLPIKNEYIDHINMCHDFATENAGLVSNGKALHLTYNTVCRFWNQCSWKYIILSPAIMP